mgnify:FL=1
MQNADTSRLVYAFSHKQSMVNVNPKQQPDLDDPTSSKKLACY